ncbi:MAG TPA: phosphatase PAP2 family protein [Gemmatimonadaceae bacterium]|nr:phosphatase PAP2 family protein [Gemmatimonadaceae bacterium]
MKHRTRPNAMQRHMRASIATGLLVVGLLPDFARAQQKPIDPRDTTHAQTQAPFFTFKDAVLAGIFAGTTLAMFPLDKKIAMDLRDSATQANRLFRRASTGFEVIASPGAYLIGGGLYAIGKLGGYERVADLGWHGTEAVLFAQGITFVLKGTVGRGRPFLSQGEDPGDYHPGQGFRSANWTSFPSGHTSTAFAAAAAVTNETTRWWPRSTWIVGPLMYGGATAVGLSRMYHSRHWGSDVALGAAIGTFSGRKIVQYAHGHPGNRLDRFMLRTSIVPDGRGGALMVLSLPSP